MKFAVVAAIGLGCCLSAAGAAGEPATLTPSLAAHHAPTRDDAEGGLWMVSAQCEKILLHSPRRVLDPVLDQYLSDIVCRLAADYCDDIRVYVVRTPHFNASMLPNGAMQVWTGLLVRVRDEAQLAAVLGHELGHYLRRHGLQQMEDMRRKSNLLTLFSLGLGAAVVGGGIDAGAANVASAGAHLGTLGSIFAFSREHEAEADRYGLRLLTDAGYDPDAAPTVWQDLIAEDRADGEDGDSHGGFFATHPAPEQRMADLRAERKRLGAPPTIDAKSARQRYLDVVQPHLSEWLEDEVAQHKPKKSEFLFRRLLDAGFAPGIVHYQLGEVLRREDTSKQSAAALAQYEAALAFPDAPPEAHRALGLWKLKARNMSAARTHFNDYLAAAPAAGDRAMIEYYLTLTEAAP